MKNNLFAWAVSEIEAEYARLGHPIGWRFLMTPARTLRTGVPTALITLNPGGRVDPADHPKASYEGGSAYVHERWASHGGTRALYPPGGAPLQRQIQALFRLLGENPDESLSAYFIPFRSPSLKELHAPMESRAFSRRLWRRVLPEVRPRRIVTLGQDAFQAVIETMGAPESVRLIPSGWGAVTLARARFGASTVFRLPHLSTFKLFSKTECRGPLQELFGDHGK